MVKSISKNEWNQSIIVFSINTSIWTAFDSTTSQLSFNNKDIDSVLKNIQSGQTSAQVFQKSLDSLNGTIA